MSLMRRNIYQVLGKDLNTPSEFVICWTKNGQLAGGTSFAMRVAYEWKVPVYNLFYQKDIDTVDRIIL